MLGIVLRSLLYVAFILLVLQAYRWIRRQSPLLGNIFAAGLVARAALGTALYAISFLQLAVLPHLQLGEGFWVLAIDGRWYFQSAAQAATLGLETIRDGSASPAFVRLLAVWMRLFGISPASAVLLNVACYVCAAVLIVRFCKSTRASVFTLLVLTCSPALLIFGTQPLKDTYCVLLVLLAGTGVRLWVDGLAAWRGASPSNPVPRERSWARLVAGAALLMLATYEIGGIRAYFGLFMLFAVALTAVLAVLVSLGHPARRVVFAAYAGLVPLVWLAFSAGAGIYTTTYSQASGIPLDPAIVLQYFDSLRSGFSRTGGATSLAGKEEAPTPVATSGVESSPGADSAIDSATDSATDLAYVGATTRLRRLAIGWAALFVPMSILHKLSLATFEGGRGLLLITDIDTLFIDAAMVGSLIMLFMIRPTRDSSQVLLFMLALALVTTVSMAYVVTNFGTLFRLRLLAVAPIWFIPALVRGQVGEREFRVPAAMRFPLLTKAESSFKV